MNDIRCERKFNHCFNEASRRNLKLNQMKTESAIETQITNISKLDALNILNNSFPPFRFVAKKWERAKARKGNRKLSSPLSTYGK